MTPINCSYKSTTTIPLRTILHKPIPASINCNMIKKFVTLLILCVCVAQACNRASDDAEELHNSVLDFNNRVMNGINNQVKAGLMNGGAAVSSIHAFNSKLMDGITAAAAEGGNVVTSFSGNDGAFNKVAVGGNGDGMSCASSCTNGVCQRVCKSCTDGHCTETVEKM